MRSFRVLTVPALAFGLVLAACESEMPVEPEQEADVPEALADYGHKQQTRAYQVTIYNGTKGQPFTPPVAATHKHYYRVFQRGHRAGNEIQQVAENGNNGPLLAKLEGSEFVHGVFQGGAPIMPGASMTFEIEGTPHANRLSWVAMLICSNDGFAGSNTVRLPRRVGQSKTYGVRPWDAGTEKNTEDFTDLVPPCPALTGVETDEMGTGMSNPDLATNQRVRRHRGVKGRDDLIPSLHGFGRYVAKIEVTRIR